MSWVYSWEIYRLIISRFFLELGAREGRLLAARRKTVRAAKFALLTAVSLDSDGGGRQCA